MIITRGLGQEPITGGGEPVVGAITETAELTGIVIVEEAIIGTLVPTEEIYGTLRLSDDISGEAEE